MADEKLAIDSRKLLSLYYFSSGSHEEALKVLQEIRNLAPDDVEVVENMGVLLRLLGRREEAIEALLEAHRQDPSRFNVCDALAHTFGALKNREQMLHFGRLSLELKDAKAKEVSPLRDLSGSAPPPFDPGSSKKNILSFSLWGNHPRYLRGAIRNVQAAFDLYPGWICRFYCDDSVPLSFREHLQRHHAEIVLKPRPAQFFDGLLWRFEVIDDPSVDRYLVRDCDSVVSVQERVAVDEWLASDKWFHAMRDFPSHTEVILAGMWGGAVGGLPFLKELRDSFRPTTAPTRTFDQVFLRECVWPIVRQSVLIHDSVYTGCLGSQDFPELGRLPETFHVGQNEAAVRKNVVVDLPESKAGDQSSILILTGADAESVGFVAEFLGAADGVSILNEGTFSEMITCAEETLAGFLRSPRKEEEDLSARRRLISSILDAVCRDHQQSSSDSLVLIDDRNDLEDLMFHVQALGARLLCVIRDPRDTASLRRINEDAEAREWGQEWKASIETIGAKSRAFPGKVELVRYEDFGEPQYQATCKRLTSFLGNPKCDLSAIIGKSVDTGKPLPSDLASAIEETAGDMMKKLRYLETE